MTDALSYLEGEISNSISSFRSSRTFYRRGSLVQTVLTASLGALTTLLIGLVQIYPSSWLSAISLGAAGLTTIAAAWGGWFGFRRLWISNQNTLNELYALRTRIEFDKRSSGAALDPEMITAYLDKYQAIMTEANRRWEKVRLFDS